MPKQPPTLYSIPKTFMWFAIVSILLTLSLVGIVAIDYSREWKGYQKKFVQLKTEKIEADLKMASTKEDKSKLEELKKEYSEAQKVFAAHQSDYQNAQKEADEALIKARKVRDEYQTQKQYQDSYKYFLEEYGAEKKPQYKEYSDKYSKITPVVASLKSKLELLEKDADAKEERVNKFLEKEKTIQKEIMRVSEEVGRLEKRLEKTKPSLVKDILDAPVINFMAPSLQIQQVVLEDLHDDFHFAKVQKVDRCTTCHLGIDQKGFESAPQPFRTHPNLDKFLSATSPHPIEKIGCTVCHGGNGHSVSFKDSAHTPQNVKQGEEWAKKYQWRELEKWDQKMLPLKHIEASCAKCHHGAVEVPGADKLNRGRRLASELGCVNCHKITGFEDHWKVGPDLQNVKSKLTEDWIARWVNDPKSFREHTKMPRVFNLSNTSTPEDKDRNDVAIASIASYLIKHSETIELAKPAKAGNVVNGEKLVKDLGCLGCHAAAGVNAANYGPELTGLGSKVTSEWLYTWLKNPHQYSKDTRMPNLRLSDDEASDITAYLLSLKNEAFESKALPSPKESVMDQMILETMQSNMRQEEAKSKINTMSREEKMDFLGKRSIEHQGCYTCHAIKGFETAKPIGADLSNEGRKPLHQFDFGFVEIERTRHDWIIQKLKDPRIFDHGKIKSYYEKLRMPQFNLTDAEIEDLTTFALSLTEENIPLEMQRKLSLKDQEIETGRLLAQKYNCVGCHTLDGKTGVIRSVTTDEGANPPILDGEGAKVQEIWLYHFLHAPTPIRPWLTYRMPTFGFTEEELAALVRYFDNLAGQEISLSGEIFPETSPESLEAGKKLFDTFQCAKCHEVNADSAAMGSSFLAPDLVLTKKRLKADWVSKWLEDPQVIQSGTMMPTFFSEGQSPVADIFEGDAKKQITAIRDYLYRYEGRESSGADAKAVAKDS